MRTVLAVSLASTLLIACAPSSGPHPEVPPAIRPPSPPSSPAGSAPFEDHFTATFHRVAGAYCTLTASAAKGVAVEGCGFPATVAREDRVPTARQGLLPELRAAVLREEPDAKSLHFRHDGTYRSVYLEEEVPCAGKHGQGYNVVELRYDERLETILDRRYVQGSNCGAAPFYWASSEPRWLQTTSPQTLLGIETAAAPLPPEFHDSLRAVLRSPERTATRSPGSSARPTRASSVTTTRAHRRTTRTSPRRSTQTASTSSRSRRRRERTPTSP